MTSIEDRLAQLELRLQSAEDRLAIANLIASYGPAVDTLDGQTAAELWTDDGTYVIGDDTVERAGIAGVVNFDAHRAYVSAGCGHVLSPARIDLSGDTAIAVNYSIVFMHEAGRWVADRMSANRWECVRTPAGWKVSRRANRVLTGAERARALLAAPAASAS